MKPTSAPSGLKARILVVDDHPLFREGVVQLLNRQDDLLCCGEADSVPATSSAVSAHHPDLVLLDLRLGDGDGLELVKSLKAQFPSLPSVVLSQCDEALYAERALRAGALGYVMKQQASEEVLAAIRCALTGEPYVSRKMAVLILRKLLEAKSEPNGAGVENLSDRELQVFQLLGAGLSTQNIADELKLSVKTIETYRENLKHKLGLPSARDLVRYATAWLQGQRLPAP